MSIQVGNLTLRNRVLLAPMSGVSDEPFRAVAHAAGAGLVVSEMVASEELVQGRPDMVRRAAGAGRVTPFAMQLAGREARWMAEGARHAEGLGADLIDINMGCPAKQVTGGLSGSALMRDLDHALKLIEATVDATTLPVTLKMRLGWDHGTINAPELARRAEAAGIRMVTVHGRTRCQFYGGRANWSAIAKVREAIKIPLIANGDCATLEDSREMLEASGADGVMVGRGAYGRPWWPAVIAEGLDPGSGRAAPTLAEEAAIIIAHHQETLHHHGAHHGNRIARKHLGWAIGRQQESGRVDALAASAWRERLLRTDDNAAVTLGLDEFYRRLLDAREALAA